MKRKIERTPQQTRIQADIARRKPVIVPDALLREAIAWLADSRQAHINGGDDVSMKHAAKIEKVIRKLEDRRHRAPWARAGSYVPVEWRPK